MKLFPSDQERIITAVVLALVSGLLFGLLVNVGDKGGEKLLSAFVTLGAAFLGATVAFLLENRTRKRKERAIQLEAANSLLYMLYERLNCLKIFQKDHIDPQRENLGRMIEIRPIPNFRSPKTNFSASTVAFIFNTKFKDIMFNLHVIEEVFSESINLINIRNYLHINVYQRALEARGHKIGESITDHDVRAAIGPMNFELLDQTTNNMIYMVDRYVAEGNEFRIKLIKVFSEIFSKEEVFSFELLKE
jgi:hypothetical protein